MNLRWHRIEQVADPADSANRRRVVELGKEETLQQRVDAVFLNTAEFDGEASGIDGMLKCRSVCIRVAVGPVDEVL